MMLNSGHCLNVNMFMREKVITIINQWSMYVDVFGGLERVLNTNHSSDHNGSYGGISKLSLAEYGVIYYVH